MKVMNFMFLTILLLLAGNLNASNNLQTDSNNAPNILISKTSPSSDILNENVFLFDEQKAIKLASFKCGIAPIPPLGCRVGSCVCDASGRNCQWTFVCN